MEPFQVEASIVICRGETRVPLAKLRLLNALKATGSISKAAQICNMSYKGAWDTLKTMQQLFGVELVSSEVGGRGGGGSHLTQEAEELIAELNRLEGLHATLVQGLASLGERNPLKTPEGSRLMISSSARNQLKVQLSHIEEKDLFSLLLCQVSNGPEIQVSITRDSCQSLNLKIGQTLLLLIKAPAVSINPSSNQDFENCLKGRVLDCRSAASGHIVTMQLAGGQLTTGLASQRLEPDSIAYAGFSSLDPVVVTVLEL